MSYYKYTLEELTKLKVVTVSQYINKTVKTFWRGFAELAKTLKININYSTI